MEGDEVKHTTTSATATTVATEEQLNTAISSGNNSGKISGGKAYNGAMRSGVSAR